MGSRFDEIYKVRKGEEITADFFDRRFRDLDARLSPVEGVVISWQEAVRIVQDRVLERSEAVIANLRDKLVDLTQLQWLTADSGSTVILTEGADAQFQISEASRGLFAPGPYAIVSRDGDPTAYAVVRNVAYDREYGQWATHVEATFGDLSGPHSDWSIAAVAGSTLAQRAMLDEARALRTAAAGSATAAASSAAARAGDRTATGQDRTATGQDRTAAETARKAAELAATNAAKFDPAAFYAKGESDARFAGKAAVEQRFADLAGNVSTAHDTLGEIEADLAAKQADLVALNDALSPALIAAHLYNSRSFV